MSKSGKVPPKAAKVLGIGQTAKKPTGVAGVAKKITAAVSKAKAPTPPKAPAFKAATPATSGKMKPGAPVLG